jgi:hypothetical protein
MFVRYDQPYYKVYTADEVLHSGLYDYYFALKPLIIATKDSYKSVGLEIL